MKLNQGIVDLLKILNSYMKEVVRTAIFIPQNQAAQASGLASMIPEDLFGQKWLGGHKPVAVETGANVFKNVTL